MDDAGADGAVLEPEVLHRLHGVVVAVPHGDVALREEPRYGFGRVPGDVEAERRDATVHRAQAVEVDVLREGGEEAVAERPLVAEHRLPAQRLHVTHRRDETGEELVLARPELEAVADGLVRGRTDLVRAP